MAKGDFLSVNGIPLRVAERGSNSVSFQHFGRMAQAFSGRQKIDRTDFKNQWSFETVSEYSVEDADAVEGWLAGHWSIWRFGSDMWSDQGDPVAPGFTATVSGGFAAVTSATFPVQPPLTDVWSIMALVDDGGGFERHTVSDNGDKWLNKVYNPALATPWLTVTASGQVIITSINIDDLIVMRFRASQLLVNSLHDWQDAGGVFQKNLNVQGDFFPPASLEMIGHVAQLKGLRGIAERPISFSLSTVRIIESFAASAIQKEDGDYLLKEDSSKLLLE